jgi:hypothetical protein
MVRFKTLIDWLNPNDCKIDCRNPLQLYGQICYSTVGYVTMISTTPAPAPGQKQSSVNVCFQDSHLIGVVLSTSIQAYVTPHRQSQRGSVSTK